LTTWQYLGDNLLDAPHHYRLFGTYDVIVNSINGFSSVYALGFVNHDSF